MGKRVSSPSVEADPLAELAGEIQRAEAELEILRDVAEEIRDLLSHAECNPRSPTQPPFQLVSMALDPCAADFGARLNRTRPEDLPEELRHGHKTFSLVPTDNTMKANDKPAPLEPSPATDSQQLLF